MADVTGSEKRDYVEPYGIDSDAGPIFIGAGDDIIDTLGGDDWIVGTGGSDTISGGVGHDTYAAHLGTAITIDSAADEKFGSYTGSAGDVDGDGLGDMLIGGGGGDVYLVTGAALNDGDLIGADAKVDIDADLLGQHGTVKLVADGLVEYGASNSAPNYTNYTALGDIDGDGKGDFLIGAPGSDVGGVADAGTAWLVTSTFLDSHDAGSDNTIDLDDALTANAAGLYAIRDSDPAANGTGATLGAADLIGSDGAIDLVIGSPGNATGSAFTPGVTRVIDGASLVDLANSDGVIDLANLDPDNADAMVTLRGEGSFPAANALAPISDFSGDERAELGLSAPYAWPGFEHLLGRNYVITSQALEDARGTDIVIDANLTDGGAGYYEFYSSSSNLGTNIAGAGDVDGDRVGDLLLSGTSGSTAPGFSYFVSGAALGGNAGGEVDVQQLVSEGDAWKIEGADAVNGARMVGLDLAGLGDVDGDGKDEFAVTSPLFASDTSDLFYTSLMMWVSNDDLDPDSGLFGSDGTLVMPKELQQVLSDGDFAAMSGGFIGGSLGGSGAPQPEENSPASFVSAGGDIDGDGRADIVTHARFNVPRTDPDNPEVSDIYVTIAPSASLAYQAFTQTEGNPGENPVGFYAPGLEGYAFQTIDVMIGAADEDEVVKGDGGTDTVTGVEAYRGSGGAGDKIDFTALGVLQVGTIDDPDLTDTEIAFDDQGALDTAVGTYSVAGRDPVAFGGPGQPTLRMILGDPETYGSEGTVEITSGAEDGRAGGVDFNEFEAVTFDVLICFANGTRIATPQGERLVEDIRPGDLVLTRDHGPQPVRWAGRRAVGTSEQIANHRLRPVRIRTGALGPGVPARDLRVSRQHRIWVRDGLIAAVQLIGRPGIDRDDRCVPVSYHHLLCDGHEILFANGVPAESLLPAARPLTDQAPPRHAPAAVAEL